MSRVTRLYPVGGDVIIPVANLTDATALTRAFLKAGDEEAAQTALGATTVGRAVFTASDGEAARDAIGAASTDDMADWADYVDDAIVSERDAAATINNKTINVVDNQLTILDNDDNTKKLRFDVSQVSSGVTKTIVIPGGGDGVMVTELAAQSLSNKTMDSVTNTVRLVANKFSLADPVDTTKGAQFDLSLIDTETFKTFYLPGGGESGLLLTASSTANVANKVLTGGNHIRALRTGLAKPDGGNSQWGVPGGFFYGSTTTTLTPNQIRYVPLWVPNPVVLTALQFEVTTGPASTAKVRVGIVPADNELQPDGTPVDFGEISVASGFTGLKTLTGLSAQVFGGPYLLLMNCDVSMTLRAYAMPSPIISASMGSSGIGVRFMKSATYGAFDGSLPDWTDIGWGASVMHSVVFQWSSG